jgi:DNA polymerase-3 subunit delta'
MAMKSIVGNEKTLSYLNKSVLEDNLSHAYLFCGPESVGKTKTAIALAKQLLCEGTNPSSCNDCPSCKLFVNGNHPDFFQLDHDPILVEEIRELVNSLELRPYRGRGKVALLSHAEKLTTQALNAFLKTLEEPTSQTTIILTTENKKNLLPTIVSRARLVNFCLVPEKQIFEHLNSGLGVKKDVAQSICGLAAGRIGVAISLFEGESAIADTMEQTTDFSKVYRSQDIFEKISYANSVSRDKDSLISKLQAIELWARGELLGLSARDGNRDGNKEKINEMVALMDNIAKSRELIKQNVNAKLVIEGLLLGSL